MNALLICALAMLAIASARPNEEYTDKYDGVNVEEILENRRLLAGYIKCCLDQAKCTAEGTELKSHIREALETFCAKCTETQRNKTKQVLGHLINKEPEFWDQLVAKYDPMHKYTTKYEKELKTLKAEN